tara:strand:+ start:254 stop:547 length:294 start_codon:yes stop_codon:yes gene_type:complete
MKSAKKLLELGCGKEMVQCQIERGTIQATINNAKDELKYLNYAQRTGLYVKDVADVYKKRLYEKVMAIQPLVDKFNLLYGETYNDLQKAILNRINTK